jgi:acetylornithine deacetylase/succinyl-diaminopimelate desuccinylase-like protein
MIGPNQPALTYSLRGSVALEVELRTANNELHAGAFGGAVTNPLHLLCDILSSFHDGCGRIAVPGFYDAVRSVDRDEVARVRRNGPNPESFRRAAGRAILRHDPGLTPFESTVLRPALNVTGIKGGYSGPGQKSAIPTGGTARLNVRLVPDQDPDEVIRTITAHVDRALIPGVRAYVSIAARSAPVVTSRQNAAVEAACRAYTLVYARPPTMVRSGGSIPAVSLLQRRLRRPIAMMGFSQPDDSMHAANERFGIDGLWKAVRTCVAFHHEFGAMTRHQRKI